MANGTNVMKMSYRVYCSNEELNSTDIPKIFSTHNKALSYLCEMIKSEEQFCDYVYEILYDISTKNAKYYHGSRLKDLMLSLDYLDDELRMSMAL